MDKSGRAYRPRQGGWETRTIAEKAENWRTQDQSRGQNYRSEGGQRGKNQGGPYWSSPKKGGLGPLSYSPSGFRVGHIPSQRDDPVWLSSLETRRESGSQEDNWREHSHHWRSSQGEGPKEGREQGNQEATDYSSLKSGEELIILMYHIDELYSNSRPWLCSIL